MPEMSQNTVRSYLKPVLLSLLILLSLQWGASIWIQQEIQKRLEIRLTGNFWPLPLLPSVVGDPAGLEWKNRVTILSGKLKIDYNVFPLLFQNSIRIQITGKNLQARLFGDWAKLQGVENIQIDHLDADLEIVKKGLGEVYEVHAESPSFHFVIEKN